MGRVHFSKAGIEQGSAWGTEVALGASDQIAPRAIDISRANMEFLPDTTLLGSVWGNPGQVGAKAVEGTLRLPLRYGHNCPKLAALAFGEAETPTGADPYVHPLNLQNRLTKFFTLAWQTVANSGATVYMSVPSAIVEEVSFSWAGSSPGEMTVGFVGESLDRDAGTNGSTEFGNLTLPDEDKWILPTDGVLWLNAASGSTLVAGDALKPVSTTLTIRRPMSRDFRVDGTGAIALPVEADVAEATLALEFAGLGATSSYASAVDEFMDRFEAETLLKASLTFTKDSNNIWKFEFPRMQVVEMPPVNLPDAGRYPHRVVLRCLVAATAPTGMSGVTQPVKLTVTDGLSGAYTT